MVHFLYSSPPTLNSQTADRFCKDVVLLKHCGASPVIVHGGGPQIASMLSRLDIKSTAVDVGGLNRSDTHTCMYVIHV